MVEEKKYMEKLKYIFDNTKIGIAICNANDNHLETVNHAFADIHGYQPHELIGIAPGEVFAPECMLKLEDSEQNSICSSNDISFETVHYKKDGSSVDVSVHITVIKDENGKVIHRIANIQDISEKRKKEKELEKLQTTQTQLTSLVSIIPDLIWMKDINGKYLDCNAAFEHFFSTSKENILHKTDYDFFNKEAADTCKKSDNEALVTGTISISQESFIYPEKRTPGVFEIRKVPVFDNEDEIIGILGIARDITEKIEQQQQLIKMDHFLNNIKEGVFLITENGTIDYVNEEACKLLGYTSKELMRISIVEIDKDMSIEVWNDHWKYLQENGSHTIERLHVRKDKTIFPVEIHANFFVFKNTNYSLAMVHDITERKQQENLLIRKEKEFTALADHLPGFAFTYRLLADKREEFLYVSQGVEDVYGISQETALTNISAVREVIHPDDIENFRKSIIKSAQTLTVFHVEFRVNHPIKGELWLESKASPENPLADGSIIWHGITLDITERKVQEVLLQKKEQEFRTLAENSINVIVRYDKNLKRIYANPAWARVNGISIGEILGKTPQEKSIRLAPIVTNYEKKLKEVMQTGANAEIEVSWKDENGKDIWYNIGLVAEYDTNKNIIGVLSVSHDITERKENERLLLEQEQEFRTLIENSPDSVVRYDLDCRRIYVNPTIEKVFGISKEKLLGTKPTDLSPIPENFYLEEQLRKVITTKEEILMEMVIKISPEKQGFAHIRIVPEFDKERKVKSVLLIGRDITERQKLEEKLNATLSKFEQFINNIPEMAWIKDSKNRFIMANQVVADVLNVSSVKDIIGKTLYDFFPYEQAKQCSQSDTTVMQQGITLRTEDIYFSSDGKKIWVETIKSPFRDNTGKIIGTIGTARDIKERIIIQKKIDHMAHHDALTGLPNRILVKNRAEQMIEAAKNNGTKIALLFIDLDEFKTINDTLGHAMGDNVLNVVASRLQNLIRKQDIVSRQGGDEFVIVLSDIKKIEEVLVLTERILQKFEESYQVEENHLYTSASIGIALYPDNGDSFESLLQNADSAMYKAKELGKNTYSFFTEQIKHQLIGKFKLQNDLKNALINNEFELHYQPQIDLKTNKVIGAEALIRWKHPQQGMIPPMNFIPIAESSGLIVKIGEWVIKEACRQAAVWHQQGISIIVAVNISAVQFRRGNLQKVINEALLLSGLEAKFLELELTESLLMNDTENILKTVKEFKKTGVQLSIDDFGTGYSSLAYLKRFAVDKLKIDKSFIQDLLSDNEDATIVKTIVQMAKNLNLKTIAEGVETSDVLTVLESYGCNEIQGYYFSKPLEVKAFEIFYKQYTENAL